MLIQLKARKFKASTYVCVKCGLSSSKAKDLCYPKERDL